MSEREDHFHLEAGWPPWKDKPRDGWDRFKLAVRLALLTVLAAMIGAVVWLNMPTAPIVEPPGDPRWRNEYDPQEGVPTRGILSAEKARTIAIEEVKKREGWLGTADSVSQEGFTHYVTVRGKARRVVAIDGPTRTVKEYRNLDSSP
jgi:hypothetical protein